jgi:hypothetical protein
MFMVTSVLLSAHSSRSEEVMTSRTEEQEMLDAALSGQPVGESAEQTAPDEAVDVVPELAPVPVEEDAE